MTEQKGKEDQMMKEPFSHFVSDTQREWGIRIRITVYENKKIAFPTERKFSSIKCRRFEGKSPTEEDFKETL